jgi:hypothetical protein
MRWWVTRPPRVAHHRQVTRSEPCALREQRIGQQRLRHRASRLHDWRAVPFRRHAGIGIDRVRQPAMRGGVIAAAATANSGAVQYSESSTRRAAGRGAVCSPARSFAPQFPDWTSRAVSVDLVAAHPPARRSGLRRQSPCSPPDTGTAALDARLARYLSSAARADVVDRHRQTVVRMHILPGTEPFRERCAALLVATI